MNFLIGGRGETKTTKLVYASEVTRYPIVTNSEKSVQNIKELAQKIGCDIPEPLSLNAYKKLQLRPESILLDNIEFFIDDIFYHYFGCKVVCSTLSSHDKKEGGI